MYVRITIICIHVHVHACVRARVRTCAGVCACTCIMHVCIMHAYMHVCMRAYVPDSIRSCVCVYDVFINFITSPIVPLVICSVQRRFVSKQCILTTSAICALIPHDWSQLGVFCCRMLHHNLFTLGAGDVTLPNCATMQVHTACVCARLHGCTHARAQVRMRTRAQAAHTGVHRRTRTQ